MFVARMKRSEIRGFGDATGSVPDFASLHPGYGTLNYARTAARPSDGAAKPALEA